MPLTIVDVQVSTQLSSAPETSFGSVIVFGDEGTGTVNQPVRFFDKTSVIDEHGSASDLADGIQTVLSAGAATVYGLLMDRTDIVDELVTGSDSGVVTTGTLAGTGIIDPKQLPTVTVDDVARTVVGSDASPPAAPAAGTIALNTETKEFTCAAGEGSSGTGSGIEWTYSTLDLDAALDAAGSVAYELFVVADLKADLLSLGLLKALKTHAAAKRKVLIFATAKAATRANIQKLTVPLASPYVFPVFHQADEDVGGTVAGVVAVQKPWVTLFWKRLPGLTQTTEYSEATLGKVGQVNTLEGGDGSKVGGGNAVVRKGSSLVLSNGVTPDGPEGVHGGWLDVTRTREWLVAKIIAAIENLRLTAPKVPFTAAGINVVRSVIETELVGAVGLGALSAYSLALPSVDQLSADDKAARRLTGINIGATIAGDAQSFSVDLVLTV